MSGSLTERWEDIASRWERVANDREKRWEAAMSHAKRLRDLLVSMGVTDERVLGPDYLTHGAVPREMDYRTPDADTPHTVEG